MQKRFVLIGLAVCITILAAVGIGHLLAEQINKRRDAAFKVGREAKTRDMLHKMGSIQVGDVLPDHEFLDTLNGEIRLSNLIDRWAVLSYFDPGCGACIADLICLRDALPDVGSMGRLVLLTSSSHASVNEIQQKTGTQFKVVVDNEGQFAKQLNIHTTPFTIMVGSELRVNRIIIGALTEDECEEIAGRIIGK
jgi:peroxiredoxin